MADYAHRWTDWEIANLERRIQEVYDEAAQDVQGKLNKFIRKFKRDDKMFRQQLADGKITKADYQDWLRGQVFQGEQWRAKLEDLSSTLTRYNQVAADIVNDATPGAFAMNANWEAFQIEKAGNANMGFGLYDAETVKRLIRDEPALMPYRIDIPRDQQWNQQLITGQIEQGILQGEGIADIAKRLQRVAYMDDDQAMTHARTCMTAAQSAGRLETYKRAEKMGIELEDEWLATIDGHTRDEHAELDGQRVKVGEPFVINGIKIRYPGDPEAPGHLRYNCRCTTISHIVKWPAENARRRDNETGENIKDMTFKQWEQWKKSLQAEKDSGILNEWRNASFRTGAAAAKHERHLTEYGDISFADYVLGARKLLSAPISEDVDGFTNNHGYLYKYRKSENDFVIGGEGFIITRFKPKDGEDYWKGEKEREQV